MRAAALHGGDEQAVIGVAGHDETAAPGAMLKSRGSAAEIERRWRPRAVMAAQTLLLQHRFDLSLKITPTVTPAARRNRTGNHERKHGAKTPFHWVSITGGKQCRYADIVHPWAENTALIVRVRRGRDEPWVQCCLGGNRTACTHGRTQGSARAGDCHASFVSLGIRWSNPVPVPPCSQLLISPPPS